MKKFTLLRRTDGNGTTVGIKPGDDVLGTVEQFVKRIIPSFSYEKHLLPDSNSYEEFVGHRVTDKEFGCIFHLAFAHDEIAFSYWGDRHEIVNALAEFAENPDLEPRIIRAFLGSQYRVKGEQWDQVMDSLTGFLRERTVDSVTLSYQVDWTEYEEKEVDAEDLKEECSALFEELSGIDEDKDFDRRISFYVEGVCSASIGTQSISIHAPAEFRQGSLKRIKELEHEGQDLLE